MNATKQQEDTEIIVKHIKELPKFLPEEDFHMNAQEILFTDKHMLDYSLQVIQRIIKHMDIII